MKPIIQKILLAIDFHEGNKILLEKAKAMADLYRAQLLVAHVIEPLPDDIYSGQSTEGTSLEQHVAGLLADLVAEYKIPAKNQYVLKGSITTQLIDFIEKYNISLLIVGRHGRHGFRQLLGSSARGIVNHSPCDVFVVKIPS